MPLDEIVREEVFKGLSRYQFKRRGDWFREGVCPNCGKRELFTHAIDPWTVRCGRENKCGFESNIKELFPDAFENFNKRFPRTENDPNRTADAYMHHVRRLPLDKIKGWYTQETFSHYRGNKSTATVRFYVDAEKTIFMERLVETVLITDDAGEKKPRKANFGGDYKGLWWQPPAFEIKPRDTIWIVEGVIDAISLNLSGVKAVAALTCYNYPAKMLKDLPRTVKLVWALDDDKAGRKWMRKHHKKAGEAGFLNSTAAVLKTKSRQKLDWNDAYQRDMLSDKHIANYLYHGELLVAPSAWEKALITWRRSGRNGFAIDYKRRIYWFNLDLERFNKEMQKLEETVKDEAERREQAGKQSASLEEISNSYFEFLYFLANDHTDESWYYAKITKASNGQVFKDTFTGGQISSASEFKKRLLSIGAGCQFTGKGYQLDWIVRHHMDDIKTVETIDYLGYSIEHKAYIYNDIAIKDGRCYAINEEDFFEIGQLSIKSLLSSVRLYTGKQEDYAPQWADLLWDSFGTKGMIGVAFFLGSLFAEQIRAKQKSFPFLEVVGQAGAGKTTLIEFLWKLVGRDGYEGFDPNKSTNAGRSRNFAQVANLPISLIESDRDDNAKVKQFDWDELKTAYNGRASRTVGVKNSGLDTDESAFRGAILISQNSEVNASEAILQRICHMGFTLAEHDEDTKEAADELASLPVEKLAWFRIMACMAEGQILETIFTKTRQYEKDLLAMDAVRINRIALNHAQLRACVDALCDLIKLSKDKRTKMHQTLIQMATERQKAIGKDHIVVQEFWEVFDFLNRDGRLNHMSDGQTIAVNLNEFYRNALQQNQPVPALSDLKRFLKDSRSRKFKEIKTVRSCHAGTIYTATEDGPIDAAELDRDRRKSTLKCWIFETA
jgi:hypothetical protein